MLNSKNSNVIPEVAIQSSQVSQVSKVSEVSEVSEVSKIEELAVELKHAKSHESTTTVSSLLQHKATTKSAEISTTSISSSTEIQLDDTITAVVECKTTHGPVTIDVRENWGPLGAAQYLSLVDQGFFTDLPFFRVAPRYITQFGAKLQQTGKKVSVRTIKDDKSLWGKRDMDFGYLFFAGSGINSRHDQMVLALCEQAGCIQTALGKAPWEVPIGGDCVVYNFLCPSLE